MSSWLRRGSSTLPERRTLVFDPARVSSRTECALQGRDQGQSLANDALGVRHVVIAVARKARMLRFVPFRVTS